MSAETQTEIHPRPRPKRRRLLRWLAAIALLPVVIVLLAVGALYVPGVLNSVASKVFPALEKSTGLHIEAADIALGWPLRLSVTDALVTDINAGGDTMLTARRLEASVNPLPLLRGNIDVTSARLRGAFYQMGGPDSLYLSASIDSVGAAASLNLSRGLINLDHADLNGARVLLLMGPDTTATPPDTTPTAPLLITSGPISLRNVDYRMSMALTNDTIAARVAVANLSGGRLLVADTIDIRSGVLTLSADSVLYGRRGAVPMAGIDLDWLTLGGAEARVDSFAMHGTALTVPLTFLKIADFAGMNVNAGGLFAMDSTALRARRFDILVDRTRLRLDAEMGLDSVAERCPVELDASMAVYPGDVAAAMPAFKPMLAPLPPSVPLNLRAVASGTMARIDVDTLAASMRGIFAMRGSGVASSLSDPARMKVDAALAGELVNAAPFARFIPQGVKIPPLAINGRVGIDGNDYRADLTARTAAGRLALNGRLAGTAPAYSIDLDLDSFPVAAFMPDLGIGAVSGSLRANGRKFNPLLAGAELDARANIRSIGFMQRTLRNISLDATLAGGNLDATLASAVPAANVNATLAARLQPRSIDWNMQAMVNRLDLTDLGLTDSILNGRFALASTGFMTLNADTVSANAVITDAGFVIGKSTLMLDSLSLDADAGSRHTALALANRALALDFSARAPLMQLLDSISAASAMAARMVDARNLAADSLSAVLPPLTLSLDARPGNLIAQYLKPSGIDFRSLRLDAANDSVISAHATLLGLASGKSLTIDTITAQLRSHGPEMLMDIDMNNRPGTFDEFAHVCLRGAVGGNNAKLWLKQQNIAGGIGYMAGLSASVTDSLVSLRLTPANPVIAYKHWQVNPDNFIELNPKSFHIHANLDARGDGSRLQLLTAEHSDGDSIAAPNELMLKIDDIHLQDWLQINPFAPPIAGDVSADLKLSYTTSSVSGHGKAALANLTYGRRPVGDFTLDLNVDTDFKGAVRGNASLDVNGRRAIIASGALNDTTYRSPLNLELQVTDFPLAVANPFLPADYAALSGSLNGLMDVTGRFNAIKLNGHMNFRQAKIKVGMMGSSLALDSADIPVDSNFVKFNDFAIFGSNSNPLRVNGTVDVRRFADPRFDLSFNAANMQLINSKKAKNVELYGKGYINLGATARGSMNFMDVDAEIVVLPQTNLTYQVTDARAVAGLQPADNMVRFVNFADTARTARADTIAPGGMLMMLTALVDVRQGSTITVDLSPDGKNRAQIKGEGILDYSMSPNQPDGRLTGRFTINSGFFRYSLPVISEKLFTFDPGSYVAFNGPILNPVLSISATDRVRANVTRQGENSRLVDFDVALKASGTLERMNVAFDLSTKDDITVQNELQSMSETQRANQAMNLLLYGVYSGQGTTGNANLSGNALYGFLTSQLNTWAANTIKGVDVSFGMDQYDRTRDGATKTATQYSYKVSKSLFNDRFKIVVGGNYSTDADADENLTQNLISDVSFEYMLNDSGSMYVRLFRHTGYESILEGEVTQTGVGFVVKRKIRRLADIFNFIKAARQ